MHALNFIQDLAIIMLLAGFMTVLCHRFNQPVVLGYIIAGIIIGPYTPPFSLIHDEITIKVLADLGVIFIMFSLGLEFNLQKLKQIGFSATVAALAEIILMLALGYAIGRAFNWTPMNAIFLGAMLAISSTTITIKVLNELDLKKQKFAQLIFGILVIEDIFAIAIIALLSGIATTGSLYPADILISLGRLASFLVFSLILGLLIIPRLIAYIAKFNSKEMLLISVLGICFGFCLLVIKLNYSVALGAFLIGAVMAESRHWITIETLIIPIRDMFSAIFFVSVGLLFDPTVVINYALPILVITLAVIIGKVLTCSLGTLISGHNGKTAMQVGMGLAQIGEFSFIIATLGMTLQVTSSFLYPIAVIVSILTTLITPYLIKYSEPFANYLSIHTPDYLLTTFKSYKNWLQRNILNRHSTEPIKVIKKMLFHIIICLLIIIEIYFFATYTVTEKKIVSVFIATNIPLNIVIWCISYILSLPFLFIIYHKMKVISLIVSSISFCYYTIFLNKIGRVTNLLFPLLLIIILFYAIYQISISIWNPNTLFTFLFIFTNGLLLLLYNRILALYSILHNRMLIRLENK